MIRFRPLPAMSALSLIALVILIALGNWQWSRFQEKRHARAAPPVSMTIAAAMPLLGKAQLVYALNDKGPAYRVFTPVAHDGVMTFVDSGAIPGFQPPDWRTVPEPFSGAPIGLKGIRVEGRPPPLTAGKPDVPRHVWFAVDLPAARKALG